MAYVPKQLEQTADVSRGRKSGRQILEYTLGLLIFCIAAYFILGILAHVFALAIPDSWEARIQPSLGPVAETDTRKEKLDALLAALTKDLDTRDLPYNIRILDNSMANAFAVPGGGIFVTTGLLDLAQNDAEIAFVIAHEIGHHHHRHVLKRLGRSALFRALGQLMFGADSWSAGNMAISLSELNYSREHELEADEFAHDLVLNRIPNSEAAYLILGRLSESSSKSRFSNYLSTHPHPEERIARFEKN